MTKGLVALFLIFATLEGASAQESPSPSPSPTVQARTVRISFVPPPMQGTISLGIYDSNGQLVRILHRESDNDDFTIGTDALITEWDGKNDAGLDLPAGKYRARGYTVGPVSVEGVAYFFNDWVTDETSPHVRHIWTVSAKNNELHVNVDISGNEKATLMCDPQTGAITGKSPSQSLVKCGDVPSHPNVAGTPIDCEEGKDGSLWLIDQVENGLSEVKQLSKTHEVLRHLGFKKGDPQPQSIGALITEDRIFLVEQNDSINRLRALGLAATKSDNVGSAVSDWKIDFNKEILAHENFGIVDGKAVVNVPDAKRPEKITQKLQPNPLKRDKSEDIALSVGFDSSGSYLKTSDGLPLRTISDTPNLSRALLIAHSDDAIDIFQDDGAVVEQFRLSGTNQMLSFDCGDFELK